ncbi:hypothetical protein OG782_19885 [Streptomyces sp. NBC_00876]|uniref:hypothetical protein n=1 Tax=Streptomyces sp. NBC_00876 TaxID=2975853 RepID=UPI00386F53BC|nr:hypothetical protein OG782_19885 [Streptomyces sp. NBC_00876]
MLTPRQGEAARELLSYVVALPLVSADAQLLAAVVAIRAVRAGIGNLTGTDLRSLRLEDPEAAVAELSAAGWQVPGSLIGGDPDKPSGIVVPDLAPGDAHALPLGKGARSRVSGWLMRTRMAKPVKKATPAARLAAVFLAAHSATDLRGRIPAGMPAACRDALPELLTKGFLGELSGDAYRLAPVVGHLAGIFRTPEELAVLAEQEEARRAAREAAAAAEPEEVTPERWAAWKGTVSPALLRHVEAVEQCALCRFSFGRVANAFMTSPSPVPAQRAVLDAYGTWRDAHPDCGREAAAFTVAFRAEHGHGPSYGQLCKGLGWKKLSRSLRGFVVGRILADGWLTDTSPVPWTLRPGKAAQSQGIALPGQAAAARTAR